MKGKLHIIFLSGWYPSRVFPYNGDFIQRHAEAVSLLHRVTVIHVVTDKKLNKSIEISDTEINGIRTLIAYIRHSVFKPLLFFKAFRKLFNMAGNYDLVHTNILYPAGLVSLFFKLKEGKKYIITEHHTIYHKELRNQIGTFRKFVSGLISKNAAAICPVSKHLSNEMKDFGLKGKYIEVPNVVDTELFAAKANRNNERFSVIHVSNMESRKRVTDIMDIIKDLQNKIGRLSFYLIGENSHKYIDYARDIGIDPENIEFLDQITHQQLVSYYQKSDVFILFSESENLPCVILESFSCGTPVISNNVGGIAEYFPNDFGFWKMTKVISCLYF
jgi:glycosyltransferase involved in cell wall biosynthesis